MELVLNDEQRLLQESAETFIERRGGADRLRGMRDAGTLIDRETWTEMAEAGWLSVLAPEEAGGLGLGMTEYCLIAEQLGRGLIAEPVSAGAAAVQAVAEGDNAALQDTLLAEMAAGTKIVLPAIQEGHTPDEGSPATTAAADGDGFKLSGAKDFVPAGASADGYLVSAAGAEGPMLFHVTADAAGLTVEGRGTVDGGSFATLKLDNVTLGADALVAGPNRAPGAIARIRETMFVALGGELLGVMEQALDITVEYLKVRNQFDRPIGSFQALQHRAVDDYAAVEMTRSLIFQVAAAIDDGRASPAMASVAKAKASTNALNVAKSAIQMHGGIGFTDEHDIGLYMKRAMALSAQYGNASAHRRMFASLQDDASAA